MTGIKRYADGLDLNLLIAAVMHFGRRLVGNLSVWSSLCIDVSRTERLLLVAYAMFVLWKDGVDGISIFLCKRGTWCWLNARQGVVIIPADTNTMVLLNAASRHDALCLEDLIKLISNGGEGLSWDVLLVWWVLCDEEVPWDDRRVLCGGDRVGAKNLHRAFDRENRKLW